MIKNKFKNQISKLRFLIENFLSARKLKKIKKTTIPPLTYQGLSSKYRKDTFNFYRNFHSGKELGFLKKILYYFFGNRLVINVIDENTQELVGIEMYYFNIRDIQENTVHQAFTGVIESMRGKGIATKIRGIAATHFKENNLSGISSKVTVSNIASIKSNEKIGFKILEKYYDAIIKEERIYMVNHF